MDSKASPILRYVGNLHRPLDLFTSFIQFAAGINLRAGCRAITTDACVPVSQLPEMLLKTRHDIDEAGLTAPLFGHVGDGNFHSLLLFDPEKPEEYEACKRVSVKMGERAIELGGTCTGEHGIGTGKRLLWNSLSWLCKR